MKILKTWWLTGSGTVGVVITENSIGEKKLRVGVAPGIDTEGDAMHVAEHGTFVPAAVLEEFLRALK